MQSPSPGDSPQFPESIPPLGAALAPDAFPPVTGGPELDARDYREQPSAGQIETEGRVSIGRNDPNVLGTAVGPMPDRTIQSYDLPDQLATYDRMGRE